MGPANLASTEIRTPDVPALSESTDYAIPAALHAMEKREISYSIRALNHDSSDIQFVAEAL
jgi:hypothetical protein